MYKYFLPFYTWGNLLNILFCMLLFVPPFCRLLLVSSLTASSIFFTATQFPTVQMFCILKPFPPSLSQWRARVASSIGSLEDLGPAVGLE